MVFTVSRVKAGGTWAVANGSNSYSQSAILLSDGTVMGFDGNAGCWQLTPDNKGSYVHGTWKQLPSMLRGRLYFSSQVLTNGNVYVGGGEYGPGGGHAEVYDPVTSAWTAVPDFYTTNFPSGMGIADSVSEILPNGNVLQWVGSVSLIYDVPSNSWIIGSEAPQADPAQGFGEGAWVKLADDSILGLNGGAGERYIPSSNQWFFDDNFPVNANPWHSAEMGACFLLPNGKVFVTGALTNTVLYTPNPLGGTNYGSWTSGPNMPVGSTGNGDGSAAAMANGNVIFSTGAGMAEYNWSNNTIATIPNPPAGGGQLVDLPDGSVLSMSGNSYAIYSPSIPPLVSGQPIISNITENIDGSYHLTGSKLNGINEGACGGADDVQAASNYPLVRMTNNATGNVYYARSYNWNKTGVLAASNQATATEFSLPSNLPPGTYSLVAVANGNPSASQIFSYAPPLAPTGVNSSGGADSQISLAWNSVSGATSYTVLRSTTSGSHYVVIGTTAGTNFTDTAVINGQTYYYVVIAVGSGGPSSYSLETSATSAGPPPAPVGLSATLGGANQVNLSWARSFGATSYNIKRSTTSGGPYATVGGAYGVNYVDAGLASGAVYYYVVSAVGPNGESANSFETSITPVATTEINDTAFAYAGSDWNYSPGPDGQSFDGDEHYASTIGDSVSFTFSGTGVDWVTEKYSDEGNLAVYIDGVSNATVSCVSGTRLFQQTVYSNHSLSPGTHTIKVVMLSGSYVIADALIYDPLTNLASAPTGLTATGALNQVNLKWSASTGSASYNVERSPASGGPYIFVGNTTSTNFIDTTVRGGATYYYIVFPVNAGGLGPSSTEVSATALAGTEVNDADPSITYFGSWTYSSGDGVSFDGDHHYTSTIGNSASFTFVGYGIDYITETYSDEGNVKIYIDNVLQTTVSCVSGTRLFQQTVYSNHSLSQGTHTIKIVMASGSYMLLDAFAYYTTIPAAPTNLAASAGANGVNLTWTGQGGATGYNIKRSLTNGGTYTVLGISGTTNYLDNGVLNGLTYYYVVSATNFVGEGSNSLQVAATMPKAVLSAVSQGRGQFSLQFSGVNGQNYVVVMSTNLFDWIPVYTNVPSGGLFIYTDSAASDPTRFYRVRQ